MGSLYLTLDGYSRLTPDERRLMLRTNPRALDLVKEHLGIWYVRSLRD